ncbi:hypothetical protein K8I31_16695 [bacterium]|nr:hypothetical protein [bacterium]
MKRYFTYIKYVCGGICAVMMTWLFLTLFSPTFGGPFPFRARAPLAKYDYYKLGNLDPWESVIDDHVSGPDGKPDPNAPLVAEQFIAGGTVGVFTFGKPDDPNNVDPDINIKPDHSVAEVTPEVKSATQP